ncbi:MAG TPA: 3-phosphoshikimate 1-carboxyvinyltransferase, partial [Gammaproteobacteria bacterium]|nr:3-phosphoshikimate 1-carboxyvinyltransferase [Gammaproteobacteria bacterium]
MSQQHYLAAPGGSVTGRIEVPGDKSISHRALMLAAIGDGVSRLSGFLHGEDCVATLRALRALGVVITEEADGTLVVCGVGMHGLRQAGEPLDFGNSGTGMRLMTGLLAAQSFESTLIGDASLMRRPMTRVAVPLEQMGAVIETTDGRPPLAIHGTATLRPIDYRLPVASAQVKSAILLAGLYASGVTRTWCPGVTRDHTERMLSSLGADIETNNDRHMVAVHGPARLRSIDWRIPGDFSSAAFFVVAGLLAAREHFEI